MKVPESNHEPEIVRDGSSSFDQADTIAGPSTLSLDGHGLPTNGHSFTLPGTTSPSVRGNGCAPIQNGSSLNRAASPSIGNGVTGNGTKHGKSPVPRVVLPGTLLYDEFDIDREEFVRLVVQTLKDVGYTEAASTLEDESGYLMEPFEATKFRQYVLGGSWAEAEKALLHLGVHDEEGLWDARFLLNRQKYLELLEAGNTTAALRVLRNELTPLNVDPDQLHTLSSLIMCSEPEDLRQQAGWDGVSGTSRRKLLNSLQRYVPPSVMIPQRRLAILLSQARHYQRHRCVYHNSPAYASAFSLYTDHQCDRSTFPRITTTILDVHKDEVWNIDWSHDGNYLASASKDKSAIIWRIGPEVDNIREWRVHHILKDHPYSVGCLAWSLDDKVLLTSAEHYIKLWNVQTGQCLKVIDEHSETVTALAWLPDGSGFISSALDRTIIHWDADGRRRYTWSATAIRVTGLSITPDMAKLVTIGMQHIETPEATRVAGARSVIRRGSGSSGGANNASQNESSSGAAGRINSNNDNRMIVYDFATKTEDLSVRLEGELTSVKVSQNSQYALINNAPDEIHLWDLNAGRLARKFTGQAQGRHVIRSCFGGIDGNFVVSGSEDGNVYVWDRDSGSLLEVLEGHGEGSVNSVAWNPKNERMFASCSDDHTIRIWEAPNYINSPRDSASHLSVEDGMPLSLKGKGKTLRSIGDDLAIDGSSGVDPTRI